MESELDLYKDADRSIIANHCKHFIKHNGYVRVGFAIKDKLPNKSFTDNNHRFAFIKSVSATLVNTGKYVRELNKTGNDYDILLNPAYYLNKSIINIGVITGFITGAAVIISIIALAKDSSKSDKVQVQQMQETNNIIQKQTQVIKSLDTSLQKIHLSIEKMKQDSLR